MTGEAAGGRSPDVTIREATLEDAPAIASLHIRAWQWAYRGQLPDAFLDDLTSALVRREQQWVQILGRPESNFTWVAVSGTGPVGFVHAGRARDDDLKRGTGEVYAIYLDQPAAGRGVGRRLMEQSVQGLSIRGLASAVLWVLETNERARRFYEREGWKPDGKRQPIDIGGFTTHEVRYRTDLRLAAAG